jgi:TetR/AcrR family fatty acid metabolism transcriptional regulator
MTKTKQELVTEFRQKEIILAACRVFARSGFEAATMDQVALEAGVAKGTLYLYFRSKLDVYLAAVKGQLEELDALTRERVAAATGAFGRLSVFVATRLEYLEKHRDFFKIYQFELGHMFLHPARVNAEFAAYYQRQAQFLVEIVADGIRAGELDFANAEAGAFLIYDMVRGVATRRLLGLSELSLEEDTRMAISFIRQGMGAR